jgi:hypothetical protein
MNRKICFFEPNVPFAEKLIDYWLRHGLAQYTISYYSDVGKWKEDIPKLFADLWILDRSLEGQVESIPEGNILWWTDCPDDTGAAFKYRSAAVSLHTILGYLQKNKVCFSQSTEPRIVTLYSPIKRCMQTTFGMHLAHILSKNGRTLYLNLEGYSGFDRVISGSLSKDISDFIYYVNQVSEDNSLITQNYIYRLGEVEMIPPVLNPCNLQDITEEMWIHALHILKTCGLYDYIVVDASDFIHGTFSILRESQVVFSLTKADEHASAKWQQYCSILEASGYEDILQKTRSTELPRVTELPSRLEDCSPGPLQEIVLQAAKEVGLL